VKKVIKRKKRKISLFNFDIGSLVVIIIVIPAHRLSFGPPSLPIRPPCPSPVVGFNMLLSASYYAVVVINIISRNKKILVRYIGGKKKLALHSEGLSFLQFPHHRSSSCRCSSALSNLKMGVAARCGLQVVVKSVLVGGRFGVVLAAASLSFA
jgi:hypothetical protein